MSDSDLDEYDDDVQLVDVGTMGQAVLDPTNEKRVDSHEHSSKGEDHLLEVCPIRYIFVARICSVVGSDVLQRCSIEGNSQECRESRHPGLP